MGEFDQVEVRDRHTGSWVGGFELHDTESAGDDTRFRVRRCRDGAVVPGWFSAMEIRPPQSPRDGLQHVPATGSIPAAAASLVPPTVPRAGRDARLAVSW